MGVSGLRFVITGSAVGIGAGTARLAASRGARVVVSDMNDEQGLRLVEEIRDAVRALLSEDHAVALYTDPGPLGEAVRREVERQSQM